MTISITNLSPAKNEMDVHVNSDIRITIESTVNTLDIGTVKLLINGVEVQSSAYYGSNERIIDIGFFAKHKIKYNTKRYHEENTSGPRYGERDIYPSVFQYGYRYVCTVELRDTLNNLFSENFSFMIEEGVLFNSSPEESFYYPQTQSVGNYTPEWAQSRYNKYSNFQQLINPSMKYMQEIDDSLFSQLSSYFVQTADLNELSTLYKIELGDDYSFSTTVLDDGTSLQIPPSIAAIQGVTKFYPNAEFENNIDSFYYDKIGDRLDEDKYTIEDLAILPLQDATSIPYILNRRLDRNGPINIKIEKARFLTRIINNELKLTTCRIKGISREGKDQVEDLDIIGNGNYISHKMWKKIDSIQFINMAEETSFVFSIDHAIGNDEYISDTFKNISVNDIQKSVFWKMKNTIYGSVLQEWVILGEDTETIISSSGELDIVSEVELMDVDRSTNLDLRMIATDSYRPYIYAVDDSFLYVFNKKEEYPTVIKALNAGGSMSGMIIDLDSRELGRGDSTKKISIKCIQKDIQKAIAFFRVSVIRPDNRIDYITLESGVTLVKEEAENTVNPDVLQYSSPTLFYDLDIVGDYIVKLETVYRTGEVDEDTKITRIKKRSALVKYKLERILGEAGIDRFFVDFDQQLKILDSNKELHTIRWAKDNMLVDYKNAIVYFNEDYQTVELT